MGFSRNSLLVEGEYDGEPFPLFPDETTPHPVIDVLSSATTAQVSGNQDSDPDNTSTTSSHYVLANSQSVRGTVGESFNTAIGTAVDSNDVGSGEEERFVIDSPIREVAPRKTAGEGSVRVLFLLLF